MKRIIIIDCCAANIIFPAGGNKFPSTLHTCVSGRLITSALLLGQAGRQVAVMGEAGRDPLGDMIVNELELRHVDVSCIDRTNEGSPTPCNLVFPSSNEGKPLQTTYFMPSHELWDCPWPRTDGSDIIMFGGFFALQDRVRPRLSEFLTAARSNGSLIVYLPGFNPQLAPTITRVMPAIIENMEMADAVITATPDLQHIFGTSDSRRCYDNKISFYASLMANVDPADLTLTLMQGPVTLRRQLPPSPTADGVLPPALQPALFIDALQQLDITASTIESLPAQTLEMTADFTAAQSLSSIITL